MSHRLSSLELFWVVHPQDLFNCCPDLVVINFILAISIHSLPTTLLCSGLGSVDEPLNGQFERFVFASSNKPWKPQRQARLEAVVGPQRVCLAHCEAIRLHLPYLPRLQPNIGLHEPRMLEYLFRLSVLVHRLSERHHLAVQMSQLSLAETCAYFANCVEALQAHAIGSHQVGAEQARSGTFAVKRTDWDEV